MNTKFKFIEGKSYTPLSWEELASKDHTVVEGNYIRTTLSKYSGNIYTRSMNDYFIDYPIIALWTDSVIVYCDYIYGFHGCLKSFTLKKM